MREEAAANTGPNCAQVRLRGKRLIIDGKNDQNPNCLIENNPCCITSPLDICIHVEIVPDLSEVYTLTINYTEPVPVLEVKMQFV